MKVVYIALIDIEISNKKLAKTIKKLNESYTKGKWDKFKGYLDEISSWINEIPDVANIALYIVSVIAEEKPEYLSKDILTKVKKHYAEATNKEKINSIIIQGTALLTMNDLNDDDSLDMTEINEFVELLNNEELEIRQNVCFFLEQFPKKLSTQLLPKLSLFLEILEKETNQEILLTIKQILENIQPNMTLSILSNYFNKLISLYEDNSVSYKTDLILNLLEKELPESINKNKRKKDILLDLNNRIPLSRKYNLNKMAEEEKMSVDEIEEYLISEIDDDLSYSMVFTEQNTKLMIEFEKENLIKYLEETKRKNDDIIALFSNVGVTNGAILSILIKGLVKNHLIKGFLSKQYFYPWAYLKEELRQNLQQKGVINIKQYSSFLTESFVYMLIEDIANDGKFAGVYDNSKLNYFTFKKITKDIEKEVSKSNVVDLSSYKGKFTLENFLRIEDYCRKHYFTPFHEKHKWLTNLGNTRIQTYLRTTEQIGEFRFDKTEKELNIPKKILEKVVKDSFAKKNGFWNAAGDIFYYSNYVKLRINKIQNQKNIDKRNLMINELATELSIDKDEITKKVDEKLNRIRDALASKAEFEINPMLRDLQMDYKEFVKFVDTFEKPYLILNGKIIFADDIIKTETEKIKNTIIAESKRKSQLKISDLATLAKCAKQMTKEITETLVSEKKIPGLWINDVIFLTEKGIQNRMLDAKGYIDLSTIIEERFLEEDEIAYVENILNSLMANKQLTGIYDNESKIFQSSDVADEVNLNVEKERFSNEITPHLESIEKAYVILQELLLVEDPNPSDIDEYERVLEEIIRKILEVEPFTKRLINNANRRINRGVKRTQPAQDKRGGRGRKKQVVEESSFTNFEEDEQVASLLNDFANWKTLIFAIEQRAGQIVFLRKKLKTRPDDEESQRKLRGILEYLGFE